MSEKKAAKDRAQLKSIDALIRKLSPGKVRKTRTAIRRLHSAHKSRVRERTKKLDKENSEIASILRTRLPWQAALTIAKDRQDLQARDKTLKKTKLLKKQKAKALLNFRLKAKAANLDRENEEVASILVENSFPLNVALMVAKDRQSLQKADEAHQRREDLDVELQALGSLVPGYESAIRSLQHDIDSMVRRNITSENVKRLSGDGWRKVTLKGTRKQLRDEKLRLQELNRMIADAEATFRTLSA